MPGAPFVDRTHLDETGRERVGKVAASSKFADDVEARAGSAIAGNHVRPLLQACLEPPVRESQPERTRRQNTVLSQISYLYRLICQITGGGSTRRRHGAPAR